jgi:hypothetical protein
MFFKIFKPFVSIISPNLVSPRCLFGELEKYFYNDYMIVSTWLTICKTKKDQIARFVPCAMQQTLIMNGVDWNWS